jgi:DNA polymerase-1
MGRRRYIPEIKFSKPSGTGISGTYGNQHAGAGTSADIIKVAMINLDKAMRMKRVQSKMILQVHDELVFDVAPGEETLMRSLVDEIMPGALKLSVPLKIDIKTGKNWSEMN